MSRPETRPGTRTLLRRERVCCVELAGESPVAVSAIAPRSRPQVGGEIPKPERGVKSPTSGPYGSAWESKSAGPMRKREPLQPRDINNRKGEAAEPVMSRRRQQTASRSDGATQDASGVGRGACGHSSARNWRDPNRLPFEGDDGPYKPMAKGDRAGRESEGVVVPSMMRTKTASEGRTPALIAPRATRTCEGMAACEPNNPCEKARNSTNGLFIVAKSHRGPRPGKVASVMTRSSVSRVREIRKHGLNGGRRRRGLTGHRA